MFKLFNHQSANIITDLSSITYSVNGGMENYHYNYYLAVNKSTMSAVTLKYEESIGNKRKTKRKRVDYQILNQIEELIEKGNLLELVDSPNYQYFQLDGETWNLSFVYTNKGRYNFSSSKNYADSSQIITEIVKIIEGLNK